MTRQLAMFIHGLMVALQLANGLGKLLPFLGVPQEYAAYVALALGAVQGALGWLQHAFNPDGTPAAVAYAPSGAK